MDYNAEVCARYHVWKYLIETQCADSWLTTFLVVWSKVPKPNEIRPTLKAPLGAWVYNNRMPRCPPALC